MPRTRPQSLSLSLPFIAARSVLAVPRVSGITPRKNTHRHTFADDTPLLDGVPINPGVDAPELTASTSTCGSSTTLAAARFTSPSADDSSAVVADVICESRMVGCVIAAGVAGDDVWARRDAYIRSMAVISTEGLFVGWGETHLAPA